MLWKSPKESSILFLAMRRNGLELNVVRCIWWCGVLCTIQYILHALVHSQMSNELWPLPSGTNNLYNTHMTSKREIASKYNAFDVLCHFADMHYNTDYFYFVCSVATAHHIAKYRKILDHVITGLMWNPTKSIFQSCQFFGDSDNTKYNFFGCNYFG